MNESISALLQYTEVGPDAVDPLICCMEQARPGCAVYIGSHFFHGMQKFPPSPAHSSLYTHCSLSHVRKASQKHLFIDGKQNSGFKESKICSGSFCTPT